MSVGLNMQKVTTVKRKAADLVSSRRLPLLDPVRWLEVTTFVTLLPNAASLHADSGGVCHGFSYLFERRKDPSSCGQYWDSEISIQLYIKVTIRIMNIAISYTCVVLWIVQMYTIVDGSW